jgi:glyoxylase-like metal-dependent hydrolase (beta-lactamase superfamily II)
VAKTAVLPLDLNFQSYPLAIASYLIKHRGGAVLIESGPGSTLGTLEKVLGENGMTFRDVTHVLLTHIHLDHAGASGRLAQLGATICVHPAGAPHLINPDKLLASAARIYGDQMESLWGEFLPVPEEKLKILQHEEEIKVDGLRFVALHTPGHAEHHNCYLFEDLCFSGDVGGVRIPGYPYLRVPMPPPELHFEKWHATISTLRQSGFKRIAPTHFGIFEDPDWHLSRVEATLRATEKWLESVMPGDPPIEVLREKFAAWLGEEASALQLDEQVMNAYNLANPLGMSADGLQRYWRKYRATT